MKRMNIRILLNGVLLAVSACAGDDQVIPPVTEGGSESMVSLSVSTAPMQPGMAGSRAIPDGVDEGTGIGYKVEDFWLMEYDEKGNLIGTPQFFRSEELTDDQLTVPVILPAEGKEYTCVVVANTHREIFSDAIGDASTLAKLRLLCRTVARQSDMASHDLLMNCVIPVRHDTKKIECALYRNIAKLTLTISNAAGSGVGIQTVRICDVPDRYFFADRLYHDTEAPTPAITESGFISLEADEAALDEGEESKLEFYLPRNCRGTTSCSLASQKNNDVPAYATYVEIMAIDKDKGTPIRYRFYPGANMVNDFNIVPNRHYTLPITITGKGDAVTDSRVEDMGHITLPESNSYIVNPLKSAVQQIHSVPITRINKFWGSVDGQKAVNDDGEPENNMVEDNTVWVAEVIWQDADHRIIDFCDRNGKIIDGDIYTGTGISPFHFKPRQGAKGNVLVGVRKLTADKQSYLWSWHLWITDYNPDYKSSWQDGVYTYSVEGGSVQRYADRSDRNIWNSTYKGKYIMDRNLGAMSASETDFEGSCGLYYQFGSKNPIPHSDTPLYDINGQPQQTFTASPGDNIKLVESQTEYYRSVHQPFNFYWHQTAFDWVKSNQYSKRSWCNPTWNLEEKSIFDPSPPGWRLSIPYTWNIFSPLGRNVPNAKGFPPPGSSESTNFNRGWNFYISAEYAGDTAWYPAAGYRNARSGKMYRYGTEGQYWTSSGNGTYGEGNHLLAEQFYIYRGHNRLNGNTIRCVQE